MIHLPSLVNAEEPTEYPTDIQSPETEEVIKPACDLPPFQEKPDLYIALSELEEELSEQTVITLQDFLAPQPGSYQPGDLLPLVVYFSISPPPEQFEGDVPKFLKFELELGDRTLLAELILPDSFREGSVAALVLRYEVQEADLELAGELLDLTALLGINQGTIAIFVKEAWTNWQNQMQEQSTLLEIWPIKFSDEDICYFPLPDFGTEVDAESYEKFLRPVAPYYRTTMVGTESPEAETYEVTDDSLMYTTGMPNPIDETAPTVSILELLTVRTTATDQIVIQFSEVVENFSLKNLVLRHNDKVVSWRQRNAEWKPQFSTQDGKTYVLSNLEFLTARDGSYSLQIRKGNIQDEAQNHLSRGAIAHWKKETLSQEPDIQFTNPLGEVVDLGMTPDLLDQAFEDETPLTNLQGGKHDDLLQGNATDNHLHGQGGNDQLFGGSGKDKLLGGQGHDLLHGGEMDDHLLGGQGRDLLHGGSGADNLFGGQSNDLLYGGGGNDKLLGGQGTDLLRGDDGDDFLNGGGQSDILVGGAGADRLLGGGGRDVFRFEGLEMLSDTILDFKVWQDVLDLRGVIQEVATLNSKTGSAFELYQEFVSWVKVGKHTDIQIDLDGKSGAGTETVTLARLLNVNASNLGARHFVV